MEWKDSASTVYNKFKRRPSLIKVTLMISGESYGLLRTSGGSQKTINISQYYFGLL
jgi:hypothetical protein